MNNNNSEQMISAYEAREILRIPLSSLYYLSNTGKIKAIKVGRRWRYNKKDVEYYTAFGTINLTKRTNKVKKERRGFPRLNCNIICNLKLSLQGMESNGSEGIIRNISASGLFVDISKIQRNSYVVKKDDPVEIGFSIRLPYQKENIEIINVLGRVIRKENKEIGIKYRGVPIDLKKKIITYVG